MKTKGYLEIVCATLIWAFTSSFLVRKIDQPPIVLYSVASLIAFAMLFAKLGIQKRISEIKISDKHSLFLLIFGVGIAIGINNGLFWTAIKITTIANANFTHYLAPLLVVVIFAPLILKERIQLLSVIAALIGLIGLGLIFLPTLNQTGINLGIFYGISSAIFFALHTVIERKLAVFEIKPDVAIIYKTVVPGILLFPFVISKILGQGMIPIMDLVWIAIMGGLLAFSFVICFDGLRTVSAEHASVIFYLEPLAAVFLIAVFILGEIPNLTTIIGGLLILTAGVIVITIGSKQAKYVKKTFSNFPQPLRKTQKIFDSSCGRKQLW
jgi:drug/metabolite transporter (DMT)-like permease